jgi:hypothetical protein
MRAALRGETHTHTHEPMYDQWIVEGGVEMNVGHISSSRGVERSEHTHSPRAAARHACLLVMILPLSLEVFLGSMITSLSTHPKIYGTI